MGEPSRDELIAIGKRAANPVGELLGTLGIGAHGRVAAGLIQGLVRRDDARHATGHRLDHRDAEALEARRVHEDGRAAVQAGELGIRHATVPRFFRQSSVAVVKT